MEKTIKPRPELYEILLNRYRVNPAAAVFIDDNAVNVAAAKEMGLEGIHFKSAQQLRNELRGLGVDW